jgi:hypothetical protein
VDFIEQFNEKLLVKQDGENLQILDVSIFLICKCLQQSTRTHASSCLSFISHHCRYGTSS